MRWIVVCVLLVGVCSGRPQEENDHCYGDECTPAPEPEPEVGTTEAPGNMTTDAGDDDYDDDDDDDDYDDGDDGDMMEDLEVQHHHHLRRRQADDLQLRSPVQRLRRVAFSVRKATVLRGPARLKFRSILTNVGGGWKQDHGVFEAPHTGGYFFTFHAVSGIDEDFTLELMRNDHYQVTAYGNKEDYNHASNSVFLTLNKRDIIRLNLREGSIYEHPDDEAYTTFTGFMLYRN